MSEELQEILSVLDEHLSVRDGEGRTVLQIALLATVYFDDPYRRDVREAVVSCCEDYFQLCGRHIRWALNPDTKLMEPFGKGKGSNPRAWLLVRGEDESFSFIYHGSDHERGASAFSLDGLGMERRPYRKLGYFRVMFPLLWFADRPCSLPEVLLGICSKLRPVGGYGGIGVAESPDDLINGKYEPIVYNWAQRFPGLEADYPISHGNWQMEGREGGKGGIKGVNWLTVVGDCWLDEMGGADAVAAGVAALDSRFSVHRYDGGIMIQAGPHPQLGSAEHNRWPDLYVKLAKYLKPIRITQHRPFHQGGPGPRFDLERSEAWLRRFDDR
jgi:hypothetical protein